MSYTEIRVLRDEDLRECCITMGWYTRGTNKDYEKLFDRLWSKPGTCKCANMTPARLAAIAADIKAHSETHYDIPDIMSALSRKCTSFFY